MLNPVQLVMLRAAVEHGSFAAAATELGYTPSAVSQQIRAMERATGLVLFERFPRSVRPTPAAVHLAEGAERVAHVMSALEHDARALATAAEGRIRLGSFQTASAKILPRALSDFQQGHPEVVVELDDAREPDNVIPALLEGRIDVAVVYENAFQKRRWPKEASRVKLCVEDRFLIVPPERNGLTEPVALADLSDETWIASDPSPNLHHLCLQAGFTPRVTLRTNDYYSVCALVREGLGVAIVPRLGHYMRSHLKPHQVTPQPPVRTVYAMYRKSNPNPLLDPMLTALRASAERAVCGVAAAES